MSDEQLRPRRRAGEDRKERKGKGKKKTCKILPFPLMRRLLFTRGSNAEIMIIMMMITTAAMVIIKSTRRVFAVIFNFFFASAPLVLPECERRLIQFSAQTKREREKQS